MVKQLNEFDTLAEAQAYEHKGERMISPDMMLAYITKMYLVDALLENPTTNEAKAVKHSMQFGSEFNLIDNHPASIVEMLDQLILDDVVTELFKQALIAYANPVTKPYELTTQEEFDLSQIEELHIDPVNNRHQIKLTIQTNAPKPTQLKVMQKIGESVEDCTDWHQIGTVSNVQYKYNEYKCTIVENYTPYRELKIVSDYTLGLELKTDDEII